MQLHSPLSSFSALPTAYHTRLVGAERLQELYDLKEEPSVSIKEGVRDGWQAIVAKDLDFSYGRELVLSGVNATIRKGESVCLTGLSGAGKSTFFKLLLAIYKPQNGALTLQGDFETPIEISNATRSLFAYVPQSNFLFSGTIRENLLFLNGENGNLDEAIKTACAEFVYDLPDGLDTELLEHGGGLSEGQLQRLAIARALLSERPILLLDEATSALDLQTEERLLKNLKGLNDKTCIMVTHRPAALALADRIFVIEDKKIIEKTEQ
jgi:ATP-binding cassette subfamily B protein